MKDLTGKRFGELVVIERGPKVGRRYKWFCICDCGISGLFCMGRLTDGVATSCGHKKNKQNRLWNSRSYSTWSGMMRRCNNKNHKQYPSYGARGILVCDRWHNFKSFYEDMGERPKGMSLDRIDNNLGYYKENCRWTDRKTQNNNKRNNVMLTCFGETKTLQQWSDSINIHAETLRRRIWGLGWNIEDALTKRPRIFKSKVT